MGSSPAAQPACQSSACVNLLFDGDSISTGSGSTPGRGLDAQVAAGLGTSVQRRNIAANGRPVHECLSLYPRLIAPLYTHATPENVIVFHAGDNDIAQGWNASQTYEAFTAYVAAAHKQGWRVVVSTELRTPQFRPPQSVELQRYNDMLRRNLAKADAVVDFDLDPRMTTMSERNNRALFHDGLHPSDGGYAVLAQMLVPAVRGVLDR